jgi:hypothetical protein
MKGRVIHVALLMTALVSSEMTIFKHSGDFQSCCPECFRDQHLLGYQMFFESSGICVDTKESLSIIKVKRLLWKYLKIKN